MTKSSKSPPTSTLVIHDKSFANHIRGISQVISRYCILLYHFRQVLFKVLNKCKNDYNMCWMGGPNDLLGKLASEVPALLYHEFKNLRKDDYIWVPAVTFFNASHNCFDDATLFKKASRKYLKLDGMKEVALLFCFKRSDLSLLELDYNKRDGDGKRMKGKRYFGQLREGEVFAPKLYGWRICHERACSMQIKSSAEYICIYELLQHGRMPFAMKSLHGVTWGFIVQPDFQRHLSEILKNQKSNGLPLLIKRKLIAKGSEIKNQNDYFGAILSFQKSIVSHTIPSNQMNISLVRKRDNVNIPLLLHSLRQQKFEWDIYIKNPDCMDNIIISCTLESLFGLASCSAFENVKNSEKYADEWKDPQSHGQLLNLLRGHSELDQARFSGDIKLVVSTSNRATIMDNRMSFMSDGFGGTPIYSTFTYPNITSSPLDIMKFNNSIVENQTQSSTSLPYHPFRFVLISVAEEAEKTFLKIGSVISQNYTSKISEGFSVKLKSSELAKRRWNSSKKQLYSDTVIRPSIDWRKNPFFILSEDSTFCDSHGEDAREDVLREDAVCKDDVGVNEPGENAAIRNANITLNDALKSTMTANSKERMYHIINDPSNSQFGTSYTGYSTLVTQ